LGRFILLAFIAGCLCAQSNTGELRLAVTDPAGAGITASAELINQAAGARESIELPSSGKYTFRNLPFGVYRLTVTRQGFASVTELVQIRSALPVQHSVALALEPVQTSVTVSDTLLDNGQAGSASFIGSEEIKTRPAGRPARDLLELVVMQPGWAFEANGILHPRESEYDTQFVINGFPVYDNRSPAFAPPVETDNVQSVKVYTSGIPAEFGQKVGGVIEVNTVRNTSPGFHGSATLQGGSFATADASLSGQYVEGKTTATLAAEGFVTDRYLDPPVKENFTNHASESSVTGTVERDVNDRDRLRFSASRSETRFLVPNDYLQEAAGQRQDRSADDTEVQAHVQHLFSPALLGSFGAMFRDVGARLWSNPLSTPISVSQDRGFREGYLNASVAGHNGRHEWKAGMEARFASIREDFGFQITAYRLNGVRIFDRDIPATYRFVGQSPDREQAVYAQDAVRLGDVTVSLGLRFDHYSLLVDETGVSPRVAVSWRVRGIGAILHASYDRTFGTPPFENLLVSAAPQTAALNGGFYLPVRPSRSNYYEAGVAQAIGGRLRLSASYFVRKIDDFKDDDLLLNTGVSFPISFQSATVRGVEAKLEAPKWGPFSGYLSYANTTGVAQFPITGGLFLDDTDAALVHSTDHFWISQDQRNMARVWLRAQLGPRMWTAWTASYSSGLPVEGDLPSIAFLNAEYGAAVVQRVNFERGRVTPNFAVNASLGVDLWKKEKHSATFQVDVLNLTGRMNLINFAGLLSGTALGTPRGVGLRLRFEY
jgi:hypothetical protein